VAALLGIHANALCTWAAHQGIAYFGDLEVVGQTCSSARIRLRHLVAPHTLPAIAAQVAAGVAVCAVLFALAVLVG
jgi:hypothetical protein